MDAQERLRVVHALWATYRESGVEAALELLHPEVEFVERDGRTCRGQDRVRAFFEGFEARGEEFMASPFTFELHDPDVLVVGHRRIRSKEGVRGDYLYFMHSVRDGKVERLVVYGTREEALRGGS